MFTYISMFHNLIRFNCSSLIIIFLCYSCIQISKNVVRIFKFYIGMSLHNTFRTNQRNLFQSFESIWVFFTSKFNFFTVHLFSFVINICIYFLQCDKQMFRKLGNLDWMKETVGTLEYVEMEWSWRTFETEWSVNKCTRRWIDSCRSRALKVITKRYSVPQTISQFSIFADHSYMFWNRFIPLSVSTMEKGVNIEPIILIRM